MVQPNELYVIDLKVERDRRNQKQFDSLLKSVEQLEKSIGQGTSQGKGLTAAFFKANLLADLFTNSLNFARNQVQAFLLDISRVGNEFTGLLNQLSVQLGSDEAARSAFGTIRDFAAETPLQVQELVQAFVSLNGRGIEPTTERLRQLGDFATSQNKSLQQLVEALLDAQVGEFERLKEFGVRASAEGDRVSLSFQGVTTEVERSEEAIAEAIFAIGELEQVEGSLAKQSETLAGAQSNLQDSLDGLKFTIFEIVSDAAINGIRALTDAIGGLNEIFIDIGDSIEGLEGTFQEFWTQASENFEIAKNAAEGFASVYNQIANLPGNLLPNTEEFGQALRGGLQASTPFGAPLIAQDLFRGLRQQGLPSFVDEQIAGLADRELPLVEEDLNRLRDRIVELFEGSELTSRLQEVRRIQDDLVANQEQQNAAAAELARIEAERTQLVQDRAIRDFERSRLREQELQQVEELARLEREREQAAQQLASAEQSVRDAQAAALEGQSRRAERARQAGVASQIESLEARREQILSRGSSGQARSLAAQQTRAIERLLQQEEVREQEARARQDAIQRQAEQNRVQEAQQNLIRVQQQQEQNAALQRNNQLQEQAAAQSQILAQNLEELGVNVKELEAALQSATLASVAAGAQRDPRS